MCYAMTKDQSISEQIWHEKLGTKSSVTCEIAEMVNT